MLDLHRMSRASLDGGAFRRRPQGQGSCGLSAAGESGSVARIVSSRRWVAAGRFKPLSPASRGVSAGQCDRIRRSSAARSSARRNVGVDTPKCPNSF